MTEPTEDLAPCGYPNHVRGHWVDDVRGIYWCPDCGTEIWVGEEEGAACVSCGGSGIAGSPPDAFMDCAECNPNPDQHPDDRTDDSQVSAE
jgi:hypothetical protein